MKFKFLTLFAFFSIATIIFLISCDKNNEQEEIENLRKETLENYANIVLSNYEDTYNAAVNLDNELKIFVQNPTATSFEKCKQAWLVARIPYGQTEAYRFYGGPIDDADGPEGLINAWPMDENFIDYVDGNADAGLINDPATYPEITKAVLADLNEKISEESIFTGYHAIEFLLWGQDLSATSAGVRPYTDFVAGAGGTAKNQARRGQYLLVVSDLLLGNLQSVIAEWKTGGAYRKDFLEKTALKIALGRVFTGLGELSKGELAGERMFVAVDTKDQENEHSCFSDNTLTDIKMNFAGLRNVWTGTYKRMDGTTISGLGFQKLAERIDATKAKVVDDSFAEADKNINDIPAPFDQTIVNNSAAVLPAISSLRTLSDRLTEAGVAIGAEF